jgi:hypothetical protein
MIGEKTNNLFVCRLKVLLPDLYERKTLLAG